MELVMTVYSRCREDMDGIFMFSDLVQLVLFV